MQNVRTRSRPHQPLSTSASAMPVPVDEQTTRLALIHALIPLGLRAVEEALHAEVQALAGPRYAHGDGHPEHVRWGHQAGSVYVADHKVPIRVPRVRNRTAGVEGRLATYAALQTPRVQDAGLFRRILGGISARDYEAAADAIPAAFGLATSSVSRRFVRASARALQQRHERRHDDQAWVALFLDGQTFAEDQMMVALGVTTTGEKRILGLVQTATENKAVCATLLRELVERGFSAPAGLLVVLDGAKGLRAAVRDVFGDAVAVQRCQWHKREHVVRYLPKAVQGIWRQKLQAAYAHPTHPAAHRALQALLTELRRLNESAARSLEEGLDETLTLHQLGVFTALGVSFKTTNVIENVMAQLERKTHRVNHWKSSNQKLRWCAAAALQIEPRLRRVKGCDQLPLLQAALARRLHPQQPTAA